MGVREVAAALIVRGGKVLLARRYRGDEQGGLWEFPGGGREEGEGFKACLARELAEELGVEVEVRGEVAALRHDYGPFSVELHLFRAVIVWGEPQPRGCAEVRWVSWGELEGLELAPADARLVELLRRETGGFAGGG